MIGIIYVGNINRCPYLNKYTDILEENSIDYEVIYWDRASHNKDLKYIEGTKKNKYHIYSLKSKELRHPALKIIDFYRFSRFVKYIINEMKYEKLILLTTMSGIIITSELKNKYKNKYIFDYRDASFEYFRPFKRKLGEIIENSYFTCISSEGFLEILPQSHKYIMTHNIPNNPKVMQYKQTFNDKIAIGYIGGIRESKYMKKLIDLFKGDNRFEFVIHGGGENLEELIEYAKESINIIFTGPYVETEKAHLVKNLDLICYNYPESYVNNYATANKFYDSLIYKKPLIGNIKTYSGMLIQKSGVGVSLDFDDVEYKNKIFSYYNSLNFMDFESNCNSVLDKIEKDNKLYMDKIEDFISE